MSAQKKVLFLVNSLKFRSGIERVACNLANELVETNNFDVTIINRNTDKKSVAYELNDAVKVQSLKGNLFSFYIKLKEKLSKNNYDYIVVHNMGKLTLFTGLVLPRNKGKVISLEHVAFISRSFLIRKLSALIYPKVVNYVVTLTQNDLQSYSFINSKVCIPNASYLKVNSNVSNVSKNKKIIAVGRYNFQKNYKDLLKIWAKLYKEFPDWVLEIYGEGEEKENLLQLKKTYDLENIYLKDVTSDIISVYKSSSIYVMTSIFEGLPMVLIEAQQFSLPIISYDCPYGPSEVINHELNGFLVKLGDVDDFSNKLRVLMKSEDKINEFSLNSLKASKRFDPETINKLWMDLFRLMGD
ncbi:glycosyltransferase family 4 protein [Acinetobacter tibetensis]|jgi:glycosyltransferase involved in cell wall biosynthesis|uniref:Glycosyltransferase family 4 protein n=1 Tax=Acinetobacter tibetensis TaxID=2943497 RepID=A0AAE9LR41_9GAMM|nr:glycosyltransferase family 4 protein [Acinetobacter tibetensis]USE83204.1 glycosyltransferase family 4 protein [Acinetobacter tibetensis]